MLFRMLSVLLLSIVDGLQINFAVSYTVVSKVVMFGYHIYYSYTPLYKHWSYTLYKHLMSISCPWRFNVRQFIVRASSIFSCSPKFSGSWLQRFQKEKLNRLYHPMPWKKEVTHTVYEVNFFRPIPFSQGHRWWKQTKLVNFVRHDFMDPS